MKYKGTLSKIILFYFALSIFCNSYLMFMWSTYDSEIISIIAKAISYTGTILLCLYVIIKKRMFCKIKIITIVIFCMAILLVIHMNYLGDLYTSTINMSDIRLLLSIAAMLLLDEEEKAKIFEYIIKIFAIVTLPSVIYFWLRNMGIIVPYSILQSEHMGKIALGIYYEHYPLGLLAVTPGSMTRLCGIFDEPGVVGTLSGLFLASGYDKVSKKWALILLVEGISSFSLAFFIMLVIFMIVRSAMSGFIKLSALIGIFAVAFVMFINAEVENEYLSAIQSRIDLTSAYLFKDNRTTTVFDYYFQEFINRGGYSLWMGNGIGAVADNPFLSGSFSYKCLLYDYGVIGCLLYITFFILVAFSYKIERNSIPFIVVFIASIYQRPYVFSLQYVTIFVTGLSFINLKVMQKKLE